MWIRPIVQMNEGGLYWDWILKLCLVALVFLIPLYVMLKGV